MKKLFQPKSIAIVGASANKGKIGNILISNLKGNDAFKLHAINPKRKKIQGIRCYPSVLDIEEKVDLVIIAVPAKFVTQIVKECAWHASPIKNIVIISAGFSETGSEGARREKELQKIAELHGLNIVGPNCLGIANTKHKMNATFANSNIPVGTIGLIAQSGAFTTALFDLAKEDGLGFSLVATLGNKVGINENDLLEYFADDPNTKIIALYLEDISDGKKIAKILKKITPKKPVVIIKSGTSEKAQSAIQSHTGAMAGDAAVTKTALKDCGAFICDNFPDFIGILKLLSGFSRPRNENFVIITNAGGPGVIATDIASAKENTTLYSFSNREKKQLRKLLPNESSVENPVDVLGDAMEDRYEKIIYECAKNKNIGAVVVIVTPQSQTPILKISQVVMAANKKFNIPIVPVVIGGDSYQKASEFLSKNSINSFKYPINAINALEMSIINKTTHELLRIKSSPVKERASEQLLSKMKNEERSVMLYNEARNIAKKSKINVHPVKTVNSKKEIGKIRSGFPFVMKIDSPTILHKNTKNGVILNIKDRKSLKRSYSKISSAFKNEKIIIQRQVESGLEMIIGLKKDPSFGHVLMLGVGGIFTETLNIKLLWLLPITRKNISRKIKESPIEDILKKKKVSVALVIKEIEKVAKLAHMYPFIKELDINPIMIYSDKKPVIVDIKIIIE